MALHDALNIRREEVLPVSLLLFQSIFLGFFLGAFDVGANTLFLNSFSSEMIPKAIVISGITGIILTSLYSFFQSRISFSSLAALNLITVFVLTFLLRVGYFFSDTKWLAFALFVLMGPLNIVALVGFWGTVGRIFDIRQGKRIFGFIDTGQVVGVIISSLSVPFLIAIGFKTKNLLYISAISIFLAVLIQLFINSKYPLQLKAKVVKDKKKSSFVDTLRIPYVRTMALFVIFSMLVAFFVHYLFLSVASERFDNPDEMAKFFGGLMGTLTFVSVLIKTFVYGPLMKTYGLKISLLISPIIMIIMTIGAALVGSIFGYTLASGTFTFFFLLISLSKFFQKALKDSIESPVLKLIYQSLNPNIRHEVQARVDGTINEIAALSSGVFLTVLGFIGFFSLINYTHVLLGLLVVWFFISIKLFKGYRRTLKETLEKASTKIKHDGKSNEWVESLKTASVDKKILLLEFTKPWLLKQSLEEDLMKVTAKELTIICKKVMDLGDVSMVEDLELRLAKSRSDEDSTILTQAIDYLKGILKKSQDEKLIKSLIVSKNYEDRVLAAKYIGASQSQDLKKSLTILFRDLVPDVKRQAIWAAQGSRSKEVVSFLIDFLDKDFYASLAHNSLFNCGDIGVEMLMLAFNRTDASDIFQKRIIRIIPETGSPNSKSLLFGKLSIYTNLKTEILDGLLKLNFTASENEAVAVHQMIIEQAGVCAWNLNVLYYCPSEEMAPGLRNELELNFSLSRNNLFQLLKLNYDKSSIDAVVENLETGTGESISFAIELLDTFVIEDLKPYIFPLLEDSSLSNKVWALQNYFPLRNYSTEEMLKAIINRNENLITKYSKVYALNSFNFINNLSISSDLAAQLFNNDKVLRQISARIISNIDSYKYLAYKKRLNDKLRVELDRISEMNENTERTTIDRLAYYRSLSFSTNNLAPLFWLHHASAIRVRNVNLFDLGIFRNSSHVLLVEQGELLVYNDNVLVKKCIAGEIFQTKDLNQSVYSINTNNDTLIHYIDYKKYTSELYDHDFLAAFLTDEFHKH
jgi:ATP:ADP antiporter, AAA family